MPVRCLLVLPLLAVLLSACAKRPHGWLREADGAWATAEEVRACHQEAVAEVNRSPAFAFGFGYGAWGWPGPRPFWPGWGLGFGYAPGWGVSRLEAIQDLTAFCMRVQGYRRAPLPEQPAAAEEKPPTPP
jgi:hypothetical protein